MATETKQPALGGITDVPRASNSLEIDTLARFAVEEQNKRENSVLELVRVISVKQQVVAGTNYYITLEAKDGEIKKEYEAKVWVREWLNSKELLEFKPSTPIIGGFIDIVPPNSVEVDNLARFAVDQHNKKENANLEFVRVISAKQQVVEGFKFYITLEAKHGETKNVYETKVLVRPWLNPKELVEFKPSTPIPGGITDVPGAANSIEINNLARFAVDQHNINKENSVLELVRVIRAKQQVVKGMNYYITLEAKDGVIKKEYEAKVWVWDSKELLEFKPSTPIIGGFIDIVPPNSVEVDDLARFAVDQHNKKENANLEFVRVISAKQQVVKGFIFYITLEAKHCETKNVYETKVLVRPLLNPKDVLEFKPISVNPLSVSV